MRRPTDPGEPHLDTRDLDDRLDELQDGIDYDDEQADLPEEERDPGCPVYGEDEREELAMLKALRDEVSGWREVQLICESAFEDYARQFAMDVGELRSDLHWPATCIDWERAADELKQDFSSCEYGDYTYYYQS